MHGLTITRLGNRRDGADVDVGLGSSMSVWGEVLTRNMRPKGRSQLFFFWISCGCAGLLRTVLASITGADGPLKGLAVTRRTPSRYL